MNNMGMERGHMRKEPDNQSSGKATAKITSVNQGEIICDYLSII